MTQSTIKVVENIRIKYRRLKIEAVAQMDDCFTICQYKKEEHKNIEISTLISLDI